MNGARILVVDDNRDMANGIAMLLRERGAQVEVAHSGPAALALLRSAEFALVLTDIRMPAMNGLQLLREIASNWPLTKVLLITAFGSVDTAVEALRHGACDYLTKPFDNDELVEVVRKALEDRRVSGGRDPASVAGDIAAAVAEGELLASLRNALDVAVRASGADAGEIFLREPEGGDMLLSAWVGPHADAISSLTRFESGRGWPGIVARAGTPLKARGNLAEDGRFLRRALTEAGIRSLVAVPLRDADEVAGSVHLLSRRDDFPVDRVQELLERAAAPLANAIRAGLAAFRRIIDGIHVGPEDPSTESLRAMLEALREVAGAESGTLALFETATGRPDRVVSTGAASLVCTRVEVGGAATCESLVEAHGFAADPGRRQWPDPCRRALPRRAASPCCLPIGADDRLQGVAVLDFGRKGTGEAALRLVPLLTMAHQIAIRLDSHREGIAASRGVRAERPDDDRAPTLALRCFGPFAVTLGGRAVPPESFSRSKAPVLLKLLALEAGAPINRDVLIERLWPEVNPAQGLNRLHGVVHDLRSVIEPRRAERDWRFVIHRGEFYYLDLEAPVDVDLIRFRTHLAAARRAGSAKPDEEIAHLESAAALYAGDLFEDEPFADWCESERRHAKEAFVNALARLARLHEAAGRSERALECLYRGLVASPFREDLLVARMELLARVGRPNEALDAYRGFRRMLMDDMEAEPSASVRDLYRRLRG